MHVVHMVVLPFRKYRLPADFDMDSHLYPWAYIRPRKKKQSISGDKKKDFEKKNKFISLDKKYFSGYFFLFVFFVALNIFF